MEYGVLGRTGVRMSALALGTANFADPTPFADSVSSRTTFRSVISTILPRTSNSGPRGVGFRKSTLSTSIHKYDDV